MLARKTAWSLERIEPKLRPNSWPGGLSEDFKANIGLMPGLGYNSILLKDCPWVVEAEIAGSIRRGKEIVKDLDLVASSREPEKVSQYLTGLPLVEEVIALGPTKTSVKLEYALPLDLRVVEPQQFPYALHHFTGSKEHHTALRHLAKGMKLKINEYGIFHGDELLLCQDERFISPAGLYCSELRENTGNQASLEGRLPDLVGEDIKVFHVHIIKLWANTIEEMARAPGSGYRYWHYCRSRLLCED